ncbi:hypothetical protein [Paenibacillus sp. An7]|uniref:hypothetical protein n=1 Tax=Paenibacillus sp. An7 TaxID=2689577 RepID=UPI0013572DB5|nr:hypothetical protein [Paenibacillus sp. An7]
MVNKGSMKDTQQGGHKLFNGTMEHIKKHAPNHLNDDLMLLEDIFLQKNTQVVKTAHRLGFSDALMLKEELHKFFK